MQSSIDSSEIMALARILDELDYYELLQIERGAEASAIKRAYKTLLQSGMRTRDALEKLRAERESEEVQNIIRFFDESKRGVISAE